MPARRAATKAAMAGAADKRWLAGYALLALLVAGAALAAALAFGRAKVRGATAKERIACIGRLAQGKPWGTAEAIARAAAGDPDPAVRQAALIVLGRFLQPKHRPLIESAADDPNPLVRAGAARTLGLFSDDQAAKKLGIMAFEAPDEQVRLAAVEGLGRVRRPAAVALLVRILESTRQSPAVRRRALEVLCRRVGVRIRNVPQVPDPATWRKVSAMVRRFPTVRRALGLPVAGREGSER